MQSRAARVSFFLLGLLPLSFASDASAQGFIRYIYPPNVVSMIETDTAIQVTKPFHFANGSSSAPSMAFASSPTSGFYLGRSGEDLPVLDGSGNTLDGDVMLRTPPTCAWVELGCAGQMFTGLVDFDAATPFEITRGTYHVYNVSGTQTPGRYSYLVANDSYIRSTASRNGANQYIYGDRAFITQDSGDLTRAGGYYAEVALNGATTASVGVEAFVSAATATAHGNLFGMYSYLELGDTTSTTGISAALYLAGPGASTAGDDSSKVYKLYSIGYGRSFINQPRDTDYALELTNGKGLLVTGKTDQLQLAKAAGGAKPTCDAAARGSLWYEPGGAGVLDTLEICRKDAANVYAWVSLF